MHSNSLDPEGADYERLVTSLRSMGLLTSTSPRIIPLTGGVSSLIVLVEENGTKFCAKSALAKLKVAKDWRAPVHRNQSEVAWMRTAGKIVPDAVPAILGEDAAQNVFAMQWLDPNAHPVWKQQLMDGEVSVTLARQMGAALGSIHAETARNPDIAAKFANDADFDALRLDPYLRATASAHPEIADQLLTSLGTTATTRFALIHGDVSPKNILAGPKGPILLDAECATYGDPAFDLAFCLNHLILKAVHLPDHKEALARSFKAMMQSYLFHVDWEPLPAIEARAAALLPALALARIDGKSPVEYLNEASRIRVREASLGLIKSPVSTLDIFLKNWMETPDVSTLIEDIRARRIWDSRGRPTVEVDVRLQNGKRGRGVAPAGASRGVNEAVDLRDGGDRFGGMDVTNALGKIKAEVAPALVGLDAMDQRTVDNTLIALDGTVNKSNLGGNTTVAVSMAVLRAAAASAGGALWRYLADGKAIRLPLPEVQIFGGGAHAGRRVDVQDFMVMPIGAESFSHAMEMVANVYAAAGDLMSQKAPLTGVADEGGYWPNFDNNEEALDMLTKSIEQAGYKNGEVMISLDIAASEFHKDGQYRLGLEDRAFDTGEWIDVLGRWIETYPILSIEDPVDELDHAGMKEFTARFGDRIQIIGDDYLVTSAARVKAAQELGACNAVLIKVNQVGTISETRDTFEAATAEGWGTIVSARSGETEDTFISDLSAGWDAGQLKVGSFTRSERLAKWNQVLRMEDMLGDKAVFAGRSALPKGLRQ